MKKGILYMLLMFAAQATQAAFDPFKILLDLNAASQHTMKVTMLTPKIKDEKVKLLIPVNVPGSITELKMGKLFSEIKAYNSEDELLAVEKFSDNEYEISTKGNIARIEYTIHDTWSLNGVRNLPMPQLGTHFEKDTHFLFNFHAMVPYIEGYENYTYKIEVKKPPFLNSFSGVGMTNFSGVDYLELPNYLALIDNPIVYSANKEISFLIGKTRYNLLVYSQKNVVQAADLVPIIKMVCEGVDEFCGGLNLREYTFMLHFVNNETVQKLEPDEYGAVQHSRSGVYYFTESENKYRVERDVQFTAAHELFHLYEPFNLKTDATYRSNLKGKNSSANVWMNEGFTEYFSLLMQLQKEMITETEFLDEIKNKITLSQNYEPFSLYNESEKAVLENSVVKYKNFYNKGAVMAMMLDLKLIKLSKGQLNLQGLMQDMFNSAQRNYVLKDNMMTDELVKYSFPEIKTFIDNYIKDTISLNYQEYLAIAGYTYKQLKNDTSNLYVNAKYRYSKTGKEFFVTNISFNQIGIREGDALMKINGEKVTKENLETLLNKYADVNYKKKVKFTVKRNGKEVELTGEPLKVTKNQKNLITINKKADTDSKNNRKMFLGGGRSFKGRNFNLLN